MWYLVIGPYFYLSIAQKRNFILFYRYSKIFQLISSVFVFFFFSVEAQVQALHCPSSVTEGSSVNLQCNATGNPSPNITWIWQDTGIVLGSNGHFVLVDVHRSHTGIYQCHAWNGIGNSSINTCYLDVFCKSITCKVCSACFSWVTCEK